jgi:hypothetical protein
MTRILKPLTPISVEPHEKSIFLAGSIEMGRAEAWQEKIELALADLPIVILNPRRDEWDTSWEQSIQNGPFREQVEWELDGLEQASVIAVYFAPTTQAPITLLELGLFARTGKLMICCPEGYWRRGNVEVVCSRFGIDLWSDFTEFVDAIIRKME